MKLFPGEKTPYIFAHRGYSKIAPENTLPAFQEVLNNKVPGIELDIHLCKSGELVVTHDDNLSRVTGCNAIVEDLSFDEIKKLDAGKWKAQNFAGTHIPLLRDLFDLVGNKAYYDIEIKTMKTNKTGITEKLFDLIKLYRLEERCMVSSFNPMPIKFFKQKAPHIPTAIIYSSDKEVPWYLRSGEGKWIAQTDILKPDHKKVTKQSMFFNSKIGRRPVIPWTVDDQNEAKRLLDAGVRGIISNDPGNLKIL
ncbi:MAG: glycerophosphodiester phosphodiesterase family protein [Spirochaetales bacterium]|nr:glycerophosphodiester phosphodiesterase family protein [Spirochaetales bacterium]